MATQRIPSDMAVTNQPQPCQTTVPIALSRQNSAITPGVPDELIVLHSEDGNAYIPSGYRKVEVLIIRWDKKIDDFDGHDGEIGFGYSCRVEVLQNQGIPQLDLNHHILSHVRTHNDENTSLILYYTGHGFQEVDKNGRERLLLSATQNWDKNMDGHAPTAHWDEAEAPLKTHAKGDALAILDCCFASTAASWSKSIVDDTRTYQLLAASTAGGKTKGPGEQSFTHALCDSLEQLLKDSKEGSFSVLQLWETINTKRTTQAALIWDRLQRYKRSVQLGRLKNTPERDASFRISEPERTSLTLRLSLKDEDLDDDTIENLARKLPQACNDAGARVRRVEWVKMEQRDPQRMVRNVAREFVRRATGPDRPQREASTPRKRTRSSTSALPTPKRPTRESPERLEVTAESGLHTPRSTARSRSAASE
ncbi:hypothetical protein EK21DRAFT_84866 [Setomelanomma holmii]|uniref:Peptidase C14 caspase domain-containing protein n=1 Tax=Setomelanomma holmii TaxID=210430 RepID=A0A9P4HJQ1_9PLEO|nr:hypothetical protein EK21DRAFT_84866 [Setomelanomma holmii]